MQQIIQQPRQIETVVEKRFKKSKKIFLEGRKFLVLEMVSEEYEDAREKDLVKNCYTGKVIFSNLVNTTVTKRREFPLKEVSVNQLKELREDGRTGFVLKEYGKYYYARIPSNLNLTSTEFFEEEHKCATHKGMCKHISTGCQKVRERSQCIERYDWITLGFETFNTANVDVFSVNKCEHYATNAKPLF